MVGLSAAVVLTIHADELGKVGASVWVARHVS